MKTHAYTAALLAAAAMLLPGCATTVDGIAAAPADLAVASAPVEQQAAAPMGAGQDSVEVPLESLVRSTVRSTSLFWQTQGVNADVEPSRVDGELACAGSTSPGSSAIFCATTTFDLVKYSPSILGQRRANGGDLAVRIVMAHEVGHAVQEAEGLRNSYPSREAKELAADCASGAALADAGVDRAAAQAAIRATELGKKNAGSPLDPEQRVTAFFAGFDGAVSPMGCFSYTG